MKSVPLLAEGGALTNLVPLKRVGLGLDSVNNMDGFDEHGSVGKVPGSTAVSAVFDGGVVSLHHFEFTDLDFVFKRHQLGLDSTGDFKFIHPSTGALTDLITGLFAEVLNQVELLDLAFFSGPTQFSLPTGGFQYDGTTIRRWGILAPGEEKTTVEAFDNDAASWTDTADATSSDSSISQDGGGSIAVAKDGTASTTCQIFQSGLSHDLTSAGSDLLYIWVFLGSGMLQKLKTSATALQVELATGGFTDRDDHNFSIGELQLGWNLLSMDLTAPDVQNGAGATLSNVTNIALTLVADASGTTWAATDLLWDDMYYTDEGAPTVATGGAGNPDGTYTYRVSFLTEYGVESNAGPASAGVVATLDEVDLTAIPVSGDPQVIARRIYRDIGGDGIWRFVAQVDDNVSTTATDNLADASLGTAQPPIAGDVDLDNTPPGRMYDTVIHENRVVGIDATDRFTLKISNINDPTTFRIVDYIQLEDQLVALQNHALGVLIYGTDKVFLLAGDGLSSPIRVYEVTNQVGTNGRRSVAEVKGLNVTMREHEVFLLSNPSDPWILNNAILDGFRGLDPAQLSEGIALHDRSRWRLIFFGDTTNPGDTIHYYQYGTGGKAQVGGSLTSVDPQDLRDGRWWRITLPSATNYQSAVVVERAADVPELWVGGADGYVYWVNDSSRTEWAVGGGADVAIDAHLQYAAVPLGTVPGARGEPRYLEIDSDADASSVWTVQVEVLGGPDGNQVAAPITFTITLPAEKNSQIVPIPPVGRLGEWCRIKLSNAIVGDNGVIRGARLWFIPRSGHQGTQAGA